MLNDSLNLPNAIQAREELLGFGSVLDDVKNEMDEKKEGGKHYEQKCYLRKIPNGDNWNLIWVVNSFLG